MGYGPCLSDYSPKENQNPNPGSVPSPASQNFNPKNSPGENSENTFRSTVSNDEIPYYKKKKIKKLNDLDKYLIFAFTNLIVYTVVNLIIFAITHEEPAVLTGCFFAAFGGEILMCALIKRLKLHKEAEIKGDQNNYG